MDVKHLGKMKVDGNGRPYGGKITVCSGLELDNENFVGLNENTNCLDCAWENIEHAKQVQKNMDALVEQRQMKK